MRKLKYYVASTADGFISHEDGSVNGFLEQGEHVTDYLEPFPLPSEELKVNIEGK